MFKKVSVWLPITIACALALLFGNFPSSQADLLPRHGVELAQVPHALLHRAFQFELDHWAWAYFLFSAVPLSSALLAFAATRSERARHAALSVAALAMGIYVAYFAHTYHPAMLILAIVALVQASMHLRELDDVDSSLSQARQAVGSVSRQLAEVDSSLGEARTRVSTLGEQLQKVDSSLESARRSVEDTSTQLVSLSHKRLFDFYQGFYAEMSRAKHRVLSVERFWMMEDDVWWVDKSPSPTTQGFERTLARIRRSHLYVALSESQAPYVLFIGAMPRRSGNESQAGVSHAPSRIYKPDDFTRLLGLIYTTCVLEIVRIDRLKALQNKPQAGLGETESPPIRLNCAIADVPAWVKVIDDSYYQLLGRSPAAFWSERNEGAGSDSQETIRAAGFDQLIRLYDKNARRAYEHICAKLLQTATEAGLGPDTFLMTKLDELVARMVGGPMGLTEYVKFRLSREPDCSFTERAIVHLFELFLALHFRNGVNLSDEILMNTILGNRLNVARLWERSA